jgi:squalene-hopene/tetraprenyl-beta-curcumene cyclase
MIHTAGRVKFKLMKTLSSLLAVSLLVTGLALGADPKKPAFQYKSKGIEVPAATADEPKVKAFGADTVKAAAKYLDDGSLSWVQERSCLACHSTGVYMVERSVLTKQLGKPSEEVLEQFIRSVPKALGKPGEGNPQTAVWRSSGLASWDKYVEGKLSEHTDRSLRHMVSVFPDDDMYATIKLIEIPYITTRFELTVQAMRAIVTAPGWLENLKDEDLVARVTRMKKLLREHRPINDYELALKLQLANLSPDLVSKEEREAAIEMLWKKQLPDGGWSLRRMSDLMKWRVEVHPPAGKQTWKEAMDPTVVKLIQNLPDAANPESDPYMTAFAIVLLRESGVPASDKRIQRGITWLKENQRVVGRWWMHSLFRGNFNYITYIATAQALRALALCDELPAISAR